MYWITYCGFKNLQGGVRMTIDFTYYTGEDNSIKNITAVDFDGETGALTVQGDNGKVITYRMVKEVHVVWHLVS